MDTKEMAWAVMETYLDGMSNKGKLEQSQHFFHNTEVAYKGKKL